MYFIAFLTYSLILFIEKVAFNSHALIEHDHGDGHGHGHDDERASVSRSKIELKSQGDKREQCKFYKFSKFFLNYK